MAEFSQYRAFLLTKKVEEDRLRKERNELRREEEGCGREKVVLDRAREIVNTVLLATQAQVISFVEEVVTLALSIVYGTDYSFRISFDLKRNQSEMTPWIVKDEILMSPRDEVGGGILDVCSLALRLVFWALTEPRPAPIMMLDEPGRFISPDRQQAFGEMLKKLSEVLDLQMIVVSHSRQVVGFANRAFEVFQASGISEVKEITNG